MDVIVKRGHDWDVIGTVPDGRVPATHAFYTVNILTAEEAAPIEWDSKEFWKSPEISVITFPIVKYIDPHNLKPKTVIQLQNEEDLQYLPGFEFFWFYV